MDRIHVGGQKNVDVCWCKIYKSYRPCNLGQESRRNGRQKEINSTHEYLEGGYGCKDGELDKQKII